MLSHDYRRVTESVGHLQRITNDVAYQSHIREIYDILMKWLLLRMWGGQTGFIHSIELLPPILSVL